MTTDAIDNCTSLRRRFEGREAIYIETQGALLVRVMRIEANTAAQTITADIEEIPTPGFPRFIGLNSVGLADSRRLQWTISAGVRTTSSDHVWSHGDGGWSLFFDPDVIREVLKFVDTYWTPFERDAYQRYRNILGWVQCHKSTQEPLSRVFAADEVSGDEEKPLPDAPAPLSEGITFDDSGRTLQWGTSLHEFLEIETPEFKWYSEGISLCWRGRTCLRGLNCDVETGRRFGAPEPSVYHHYLQEFQSVSLLVNVQWGSIDAARERGFRELYLHLEGTLGPATFFYPRFDGHLPSFHWTFRGMKVAYALPDARHVPNGPRPMVLISHEPDGYPGLKADARAIARWQGPDARVNYVAWPELDTG
jgi:hypothetical protein